MPFFNFGKDFENFKFSSFLEYIMQLDQEDFDSAEKSYSFALNCKAGKITLNDLDKYNKVKALLVEEDEKYEEKVHYLTVSGFKVFTGTITMDEYLGRNKTKDLEAQMRKLSKELKNAVNNENYELAASLKKEIEAIKAKIEATKKETKNEKGSEL